MNNPLSSTYKNQILVLALDKFVVLFFLIIH